jgi:hypothetical protein
LGLHNFAADARCFAATPEHARARGCHFHNGECRRPFRPTCKRASCFVVRRALRPVGHADIPPGLARAPPGRSALARGSEPDRSAPAFMVPRDPETPSMRSPTKQLEQTNFSTCTFSITASFCTNPKRVGTIERRCHPTAAGSPSYLRRGSLRAICPRYALRLGA